MTKTLTIVYLCLISFIYLRNANSSTIKEIEILHDSLSCNSPSCNSPLLEKNSSDELYGGIVNNMEEKLSFALNHREDDLLKDVIHYGKNGEEEKFKSSYSKLYLNLYQRTNQNNLILPIQESCIKRAAEKHLATYLGKKGKLPDSFTNEHTAGTFLIELQKTTTGNLVEMYSNFNFEQKYIDNLCSMKGFCAKTSIANSNHQLFTAQDRKDCCTCLKNILMMCVRTFI